MIARTPQQALHIVGKVREGFLKPSKVLFLSRDAALVKRNALRGKYRVGYNVYEVPYRTGEST